MYMDAWQQCLTMMPDGLGLYQPQPTPHEGSLFWRIRLQLQMVRPATGTPAHPYRPIPWYGVAELEIRIFLSKKANLSSGIQAWF